MGRFTGAPADSSHLDQSVPNLVEDPGDEVGVGISWPLLSVEMQRAPR